LPDTTLIIGGRAQPTTPVFRTIIGDRGVAGRRSSRTAAWRMAVAVGALGASLLAACIVIRSLATRV
jgi:hypothetical protein